MGIAPARHVAAGGGYGDQALAGEMARPKLGLELLHAGQLRLGKAADAVVGETDVVLDLLWNLPRHVRDHVPGDHVSPCQSSNLRA